MFFSERKKEALADHESALCKMQSVYNETIDAASDLSTKRESACELINQVELYINRMTRTPKKINQRLGEINIELSVFKKTEDYAQEAYDAAVKSGIVTGSVALAGVGMTILSSSQWNNLTLTFGRDNTDKVLKTFSKPMKFKGEIEDDFWKVGIGITSGALAIGMAYMSYKNYDISDKVIKETTQIGLEINYLSKKLLEIRNLILKITALIEGLKNNIFQLKILSEKYRDYASLSKRSKQFLIAYLNNTHSLAKLLNEVIKK